MEQYRSYLDHKRAAGGFLLSAAILITACSAAGTATTVAEAMARPQPTKTPTLAPTATHPPLKTPTLPAATSTPQPTATTRAITTPRPTRKPTSTSTSTPSSTGQTPASGNIQVYETTVTLSTYPLKDYLVEQVDPVYNLPVFYFDRAAYDAAAPTPEPVEYSGIVLENPYLRLTFLPELGGRLYSVVVKATGQEIFYHNPVVKPSRYGILQPAEANWWLATGGMEWAYPTQEHGYRWGVSWEYAVKQTNDSGTITLSDLGVERTGVEVEVTLPADSAIFTVNAKLVNTGPNEVPVQFWLNAVLTLGAETMSPQTQFIAPVEQVVVHSRGGAGWNLPEARETAPWPVVDDKNLSDYNQWADYLGFFIPNMNAPFMGAHNPDTNLGVVRLIEPGQVAGNKLFAFGQNFAFRDYTDDNSQYFEIWGGANTGFWPENDILVAGGETLQWSERWWPLAGLGGLTWANQHAAIHLRPIDNAYHLTALVSRPRRGKLTVLAGETTILAEGFSAGPTAPLEWQFTTAGDPIQIELVDDNGNTLLVYPSHNE